VGTITSPVPVQYFTSILFNDRTSLPALEAELTHVLGVIQDRSPLQKFSHSDYYADEMGNDLSRRFLLFASLAPREQLPEIKLRTNEIEARFTEGVTRTANIDPGYMALEHVVLATTKGFTHRIYLGKGIWADLTLIFGKGGFRTLEWTYPDYASPEIITLYNNWRKTYKESLRCQKA
jgi:hypothetical protein